MPAGPRAAPSMGDARRAAAQHLAKTINTHPGTAASVLLKRLAQCRQICSDLLHDPAALARKLASIEAEEITEG